MRVALFLLFVLFAIAGLACGGSPAAAPTATPAASGVSLDIQSRTHQDVEVRVGTTVTWTNRDSVPHTATARDGQWKSERLSQGQTFSHTFFQAGTFEYFCEVHPNDPNMVGRVTAR
jgi:plastocyanin